MGAAIGRRVRRKVRSRSSARTMSNAARGPDAADVTKVPVG
jgi:hypothetical protein